jgi:hypothetical protein
LIDAQTLSSFLLDPERESVDENKSLGSIFLFYEGRGPCARIPTLFATISPVRLEVAAFPRPLISLGLKMIITALAIAGSSNSSLNQNTAAVLKAVRHLLPSWIRKSMHGTTRGRIVLSTFPATIISLAPWDPDISMPFRSGIKTLLSNRVIFDAASP